MTNPMIVRDPKAAALVEQALELMNEGGKHWGQGYFKNGHRYCAIGALRQAAFGDTQVPYSDATTPKAEYIDRRKALYLKAVNALTRVVTDGASPFYHASPNQIGGEVVSFNDAPKRSFADIQEAFASAAALLRKGK